MPVIAVAFVAGCTAPDAAELAAESSARNQALIVAGNTAYRSGNYPLAAKRYAAAAVAKKDDPAAHFGMGMALAKLGRIEDARQAYARSRELSRARPRRTRRRVRMAALARPGRRA